VVGGRGQSDAGEIALLSPEPDAAKAEKHFEHALAVARQQQAKSLKLRAAMSMARLWHDQGKVHQARKLLAPGYGWFAEGFDTRDLKDATGRRSSRRAAELGSQPLQSEWTSRPALTVLALSEILRELAHLAPWIERREIAPAHGH
jgi:hypothetical protein